MLLIIMLYCLLGCFICTCIFHWGNHRPHPAELVSKLFEPGFLRGPHPNTDLPVPQSPESPFLISFPPCGVHETLILHLPSKPYGFSLPHPSCPPSLDPQARRVSSETIQVRKSTMFIQFLCSDKDLRIQELLRLALQGIMISKGRSVMGYYMNASANISCKMGKKRMNNKRVTVLI